MILISKGDATYDVVRYNIISKEKEAELWITCSDFKSRILLKGEYGDMKIIKEGFDYAIESGEKLIKI